MRNVEVHLILAINGLQIFSPNNYSYQSSGIPCLFCKECDCKNVVPMLIAFGHARCN